MTGTRIGCPVPCSQRRRLPPPPTSYSAVVLISPRSMRLALAVVPPMSKEMMFSSPRWRPTSAAAITPAAGPDSTAIAGMLRPSLTPKTPPLEPITHGDGRLQTAEVRRQDGTDVRAHRGGAGALELANLRQHLARQEHRHVRERRPQRAADRPLVSIVEEGEEQADGDGVDA